MKMKTAQTHTLNHTQYNTTQALTFDPRGVWIEALGTKDDWRWGWFGGRRHLQTSGPWFYPVVEQHDVTYHRVKPLTGHRRQTQTQEDNYEVQKPQQRYTTASPNQKH